MLVILTLRVTMTKTKIRGTDVLVMQCVSSPSSSMQRVKTRMELMIISEKKNL
jgi:hypothetical protein